VNVAEFASGALNEPAELMAIAREPVPLLKAHAAETERLGTPGPETGGIVVDSDWFYASGIHKARWALCQVSVDTGAEPPDVRFALLPASDFTIKSTWNMPVCRQWQ
jgi:hypothetical protein